VGRDPRDQLVADLPRRPRDAAGNAGLARNPFGHRRADPHRPRDRRIGDDPPPRRGRSRVPSAAGLAQVPCDQLHDDPGGDHACGPRLRRARPALVRNRLRFGRVRRWAADRGSGLRQRHPAHGRRAGGTQAGAPCRSARPTGPDHRADDFGRGALWLRRGPRRYPPCRLHALHGRGASGRQGHEPLARSARRDRWRCPPWEPRLPVLVAQSRKCCSAQPLRRREAVDPPCDRHRRSRGQPRRRTANGQNHGRRSRKSNWDCTICHSCRLAGPCWIVP